MVPRDGYATLELPWRPIGLFNLRSRATPAPFNADDTPHWLDSASGCQPSTFVRPALDSPRVDSRVDVLVVAVFVVVGHFRSIFLRGIYPDYPKMAYTFHVKA